MHETPGPGFIPLDPTSLRRRTMLGAALGLSGLPAQASRHAAPAPPPPLPDVPYRIVVGVSAGAGLDAMARLLARYLGSSTGRVFVVENRPGANGVIAADLVARSSMAGISVLMGLTSHLLLNQLLYPKLPLNLRTDLSRLYLLSMGSIYLTVNAHKTPVNSLQALIAHVQSRPGQLTYGSLGAGSYPHLIGERMNQVLGGAVTHIPYQGEAPMMEALLKGEVDIGWASPLPLLQHKGQLLALAGNGPERMPTMPHVPTFAEAGLTDEAFALRGWVGLAIAAKQPATIREALGQHIAHTIATTDLAERLDAMRIPVIRDSSPQHFEGFYQRDYPKWAQLVRTVRVQLD